MRQDVATFERGERYIKSNGLRVIPDPSGRSGYRLLSGIVFVDVPVLAEDERNRLIASHTLEAAVDALTCRAGEITWVH